LRNRTPQSIRLYNLSPIATMESYRMPLAIRYLSYFIVRCLIRSVLRNRKNLCHSLAKLLSNMRWKTPQRTTSALTSRDKSKANGVDDDNQSDSWVVTVVHSSSTIRPEETNRSRKVSPKAKRKPPLKINRRPPDKLKVTVTVEEIDVTLIRRLNLEDCSRRAANYEKTRQPSRLVEKPPPTRFSPLGTRTAFPSQKRVAFGTASTGSEITGESFRFEQEYVAFPTLKLAQKSPPYSEHRGSFWGNSFEQISSMPKPRALLDSTPAVPPLSKRSQSTQAPPKSRRTATSSTSSSDTDEFDWNDIRPSKATLERTTLLLASWKQQTATKRSQEDELALGICLWNAATGMASMFMSKERKSEAKEVTEIRQSAHRDGFVRTFRCSKSHMHLLDAYQDGDDDGEGDCPWDQTDES
jgi:hypothetical protein